MEFRNRVKNRRFKKIINHIIKLFKLRSLNFKTSQKIILFWVFFNFISLFFPWVSSIDSSLSYNAFSKIVWNIWIIVLIILIILFFSLFSINNKEKLQMHTGMHFKDYPVTIVLGFFILVLSMISINFINAMQFFSSTIIYGNGIILSITSSIVILIWGIIQRIEFNKCCTMAKLYESQNNNDNLTKTSDKKNNMKLPF